MPELKAIVTTPIVAKDGRISVTPGYDPGTIFSTGTTVVLVDPVPDFPTKDRSERAREIINEWLWDFPFDGQASRANAIAIPLTYIARELIDGPTPLFVVSAPMAGTGKGLLVETAGLLVEGSPPPVTTEPGNGEEWRKRVTAWLAEGRGVILIDNVKRRLDYPELAAVLTSTVWSDRMLGRTELVTVPNRSLWIATGNNIQLDVEIARRSVFIRLDAKSDQPWESRKFRHDDLRGWVREHREALIWSLLTMVRNWIVLDRPASPARLASFESWSDTVGGILEAAGIAGFLENRQDMFTEADQESLEWIEFVEAWWTWRRDGLVKTSSLIQLVRGDGHLETMVASAGRDPSDHSLKVRLGKALTERRDRKIGDYFIRGGSQDKHEKVGTYRLELAESDETQAEDSARSPRPLRSGTDSIAEYAEFAESKVIQMPRKGNLSADTQNTDVDPGSGAAQLTPHIPQTPPLDLRDDHNQAELGARLSVVRRSETPQCADCGTRMSVVAIGNVCGRCKTAAHNQVSRAELGSRGPDPLDGDGEAAA